MLAKTAPIMSKTILILGIGNRDIMESKALCRSIPNPNHCTSLLA